MRSLLARGKRIAKRNPKRCPSDGGMIGLINENSPNGWHWQVEWINDTRFQPKPWIIAYGFSPRSRGSADYFLKE